MPLRLPPSKSDHVLGAHRQQRLELPPAPRRRRDEKDALKKAGSDSTFSDTAHLAVTKHFERNPNAFRDANMDSEAKMRGVGSGAGVHVVTWK